MGVFALCSKGVVFPCRSCDGVSLTRIPQKQFHRVASPVSVFCVVVLGLICTCPFFVRALEHQPSAEKFQGTVRSLKELLPHIIEAFLAYISLLVPLAILATMYRVFLALRMRAYYTR